MIVNVQFSMFHVPAGDTQGYCCFSLKIEGLPYKARWNVGNLENLPESLVLVSKLGNLLELLVLVSKIRKIWPAKKYM